ncbi:MULTISPECIES: ABC transporter permease [unclassified Halorhodospira]|uniref:ABC transporter permease n=1 Tax=unclassified Halorhodospira TaxID=2626748 RepID=UPI001EE7A374|nr:MULTISPECIES: ABC transporter permease [unclassified Halorhodospira]MCG5540225.1 ABC transporter permease [Halorhodospira sp. M39old]MCG5545074.1 ABC transporter permease [Halorhodospira sp. M38]
MQQLPALIRKEIILLTRDWQGLLLLFVMPVVFILIMSLAMQGAYELGGERSERVAIVDEDDSYASRQLVSGLAGRLQGVEVLVPEASMTPAALREGIRDGHYRIAIYIPDSFEDALLRERSAPASREVAIYHAPELPAPVRELFTASLEGGLVQAVLLAELEGARALWGGFDAQQLLDDLPVTASLEPVYRGGGEAHAVPNAVQQSVPAWLVFAMFFVVVPLSASLLVERGQGAAWRLRQLNVSPGVVLGARFPVYYGVNLLQLVLMLGVGVVLVPWLGGERLDTGDDLLGLWLIGSGTSIAAIGFAMLVASLARTVIQATLIGGVMVLIMAAVGGVMVPKAVMPPGMQELAHVSPMSWALEGFWDMVLRYQDWRAVIPEMGMLAAFGVLCWSGAALLYNRHMG